MADGRITTEAERQRARYTMLTLGQAAQLLGDDNAGADLLRGWVDEEDPQTRLRAVDARGAGAKQPYWLTTPEWLEDCLQRRANLPPFMGTGKANAA